MTQDEALDIMKMGHSVFLTGAAGTGKTFVLNKYIEYLKSHSVNPSITASTGIAATHIGGQTVHSFTGIGVYEKLDRYTLDKLEQNEKLFKRYQDVKVLIIDEISMLHASRLDMINTLFKKFRNSTLPFAGVQIIFCGDFFQLPPVVKNFNKEEIVNEGKEFAFNSPAWQELNPVVCYLEENYRQEDESLTKMLNDIRFEREVEKVYKVLNKKINLNSVPPAPEGGENTVLGVQDLLKTTGTDKYRYKQLKEIAIQFRNNKTVCEKLIWEQISDNKLGFHFRQQHIINNFIVDFVCLEEKLILEIDGKIHDYQKESDEERQKILESYGFTFLRVKNEDIENKLEKVIEKIKSNLQKISSREIAPPSGAGGTKFEGVIKLYTHNIDVDSINIEKYNSLKSKEEHSYHMVATGKKNQIEILKQNCLAPEYLDLKIGTKVIFVKNAKDREYQNGTLGEVVEFDGANMPIVETFDGRKINVGLESWQYVNDDGKVLAELSQIPLRYAWAITIHKSQGMTLDAAEIDLAKAFGSGMGYVALSRVRKFENIKLLGIHNDALRVNGSVVAQDKLFRDKSARAVKALEKYYDPSSHKATKDLRKKQEEFILKCEGSLDEVEVIKEVYEKKEKVKSSLITLEFIKEKILPRDIAEKRSLTIGTVISHIEELLEAREIKEKDIAYIIDKIEDKYKQAELKAIKKILQEDTSLKNKFEKLNKDLKIKIDYDSIKLLRLVV